jgi:dihydroflavonol-4-reductase
LAAVSSWQSLDSAKLEETIVEGTRHLLDALRAAGARRLVYVSSAAAVDGASAPVLFNEQSPFTLENSGLTYAVAKNQAEHLVLAAATRDFEVVVVNPAETYGPHDRDWITAGNIRDILRSWPGLAVRGGASLAHVDDVADGIAAALERGRSGERYILGGDNLTIFEIVKLVHELGRLGRPIITLPFSLLRLAVSVSLALGLKPPVEPVVLGYLPRYWFMDSSKAQRELGYHPRSARETLESVILWIREQEQSSRNAPVVGCASRNESDRFAATSRKGLQV